jgi:hypothetical protein
MQNIKELTSDTCQYIRTGDIVRVKNDAFNRDGVYKVTKIVHSVLTIVPYRWYNKLYDKVFGSHNEGTPS